MILELRLQIENRVSELGKDQDFPVRVRLRHERLESIKLGVAPRVPSPVVLEQIQEGVGVQPKLSLQIGAEECGAEPLEASLVVARVLRVYLSRLQFKVGIRPSTAGLVDFLFVPVPDRRRQTPRATPSPRPRPRQ